MKKRNRVTICLVAGVLILAVSAAAAFGSVNGYSRYKEAVKNLLLESDNFSAQGSMVMTYDGKEVMKVQTDYAIDGSNNATHSKNWSRTENYEYYNTTLNGVNTWFNSDEDMYFQTQRESGSTAAENVLGIDTDDEMMNRVVNFMEIASDTVMGELKNNFVQVGKENGSTLYQVEIAKNQVPSLVNAGLSLFAYSTGQSNRVDGTVIFADYQALVLNRYEQATGETLSEEFREGYINGATDEWYETYEDQMDKVSQFNSSESWEDVYYQVLSDKGGTGIVYVDVDGTDTYYSNYDAFAKDHPDQVSDDMSLYVGQDMSLETVLCKFGVDDQGRLTSNNLEVTFQTTDQDGATHELVIKMDVTLNNYGTTVIQPLDVGDREKAS